MVVPEVSRAFHTKAHPRDPEAHDGTDVGSAAAALDRAGADLIEKCSNLPNHPVRLLRAREAEPGGLEHAGVRLDGEDVVSELIHVRIPVGTRAAKSDLLVGPEHHPYRAPGSETQLVHQPDGFPGGHAAARVVHGAVADVPRVDVATDHDDFFRSLRADDLPDHVARRHIRIRRGLHLEHQLDRLAPVLHPMDHLRVFDRDRRVRDGFHARVVAHLPRVRSVHRERGHRANQAGHGPDTGRCHRSGNSVLHSRPVAGERDVEQHDPALRFGGPRLQVGEAVDH